MVLERVFSGLTVIAIGVILLANTTGHLPWSVWLGIFALWPLLLVSAGIDVLGRALDNQWVRALGSLVVLVGIVYGALAGQGSVPSVGAPFVAGGNAAAFDLSVPRDESVRSASAEISTGPGRFILSPDRRGLLASAKGRSPFGQPTLSADRSGGGVKVVLAQPSGNQVHLGSVSGIDLDMTLSPVVDWTSVKVSGGLSSSTLDLKTFLVDDLTVDAGLSTTEIVFGPAHPGRSQTVRITGGLSDVTLRIPDTTSAEAKVDNGLGSTQFGPGWRSSGDGNASRTWRTIPESSEPSLRIIIDTGLSNVKVVRYSMSSSGNGTFQ